MRIVLRGALLLALGAALLLGPVYAAQMAPDTVKIDHRKSFPKSIKQPVLFTHAKHVKEHKIACVECHHVYKDGKNVWTPEDWKAGKAPVELCVKCHPTDRKKARAAKMLDLRNAFHKNCVTCHRKVAKKEKDKKPPVKCSQCHAKK